MLKYVLYLAAAVGTATLIVISYFLLTTWGIDGTVDVIAAGIFGP